MNTYPGYKCICRSGWLLDKETGKCDKEDPVNSCGDQNLCENESTCIPKGKDANGKLKIECECKRGWEGQVLFRSQLTHN